TALWLGGCASYGGWEPTVDPRAGTNQETLNRDLNECKELASKASGGTATEAAKGTGVGAVVGAATGAVIGAVGGHAGSGAALGAAIGGTGGGVHQGLSAEQQYKRSYSRCMEGRGHRVIN
ncbi:MAG TPA: glycine zipper family protein, partial [Candidatus Methylomirabilis sp.]